MAGMVKRNIAIKLAQDSCHRAIGADSNRDPSADSEFQRSQISWSTASVFLPSSVSRRVNAMSRVGHLAAGIP